jgi:hypothetical protein
VNRFKLVEIVREVTLVLDDIHPWLTHRIALQAYRPTETEVDNVEHRFKQLPACHEVPSASSQLQKGREREEIHKLINNKANRA